MELVFKHRFYGSVLSDPLATFFGLAIGANVGFAARYSIIPGLQINASYTFNGQELNAGLSYGYWFGAIPVGLQADADFVTAQTLETRGYGFFGSVAAQAGPLANFLHFNAMVGYDSYYNHLGTCIGVRFDISPEFAVIGEFYPLLLLGGEQHTGEFGPSSVFSAGVMLTIGGHQFSLMAGNSYGIGIRRLMTGAPAFGGFFLGFNIQRTFP